MKKMEAKLKHGGIGAGPEDRSSWDSSPEGLDDGDPWAFRRLSPRLCDQYKHWRHMRQDSSMPLVLKGFLLRRLVNLPRVNFCCFYMSLTCISSAGCVCVCVYSRGGTTTASINHLNSKLIRSLFPPFFSIFDFVLYY